MKLFDRICQPRPSTWWGLCRHCVDFAPMWPFSKSHFALLPGLLEIQQGSLVQPHLLEELYYWIGAI